MRIKIFAFLLLWTLTLYAYEWPLREAVVVTSFGQQDEAGYFLGSRIQGVDQTARAPASGEVLFYRNHENQIHQNLPNGLGTYLLLAHEGDFRTLVADLRPGHFLSQKTSLQEGDSLESNLVSQEQESRSMRVFMLDQEARALINPYIPFSLTEEERSPVVNLIEVTPEITTQSFYINNVMSLPFGYANIRTRVYDLLPGNGSRGAFSVMAFLNGGGIFSQTLDSLQAVEGEWTTSGGVLLDQVIGEDYYWNLGRVYLGQGTNLLEIVVVDSSGNEATRGIRLIGTR